MNKTATIELVKTGYIAPDGYVEYKVPKEHDGMEITRAIGVGCSGDTLSTKGKNIPTADLVLMTSNTKGYWAITHIRG